MKMMIAASILSSRDYRIIGDLDRFFVSFFVWVEQPKRRRIIGGCHKSSTWARFNHVGLILYSLAGVEIKHFDCHDVTLMGALLCVNHYLFFFFRYRKQFRFEHGFMTTMVFEEIFKIVRRRTRNSVVLHSFDPCSQYSLDVFLHTKLTRNCVHQFNFLRIGERRCHNHFELHTFPQIIGSDKCHVEPVCETREEQRKTIIIIDLGKDHILLFGFFDDNRALDKSPARRFLEFVGFRSVGRCHGASQVPDMTFTLPRHSDELASSRQINSCGSTKLLGACLLRATNNSNHCQTDAKLNQNFFHRVFPESLPRLFAQSIQPKLLAFNPNGTFLNFRNCYCWFFHNEIKLAFRCRLVNSFSTNHVEKFAIGVDFEWFFVSCFLKILYEKFCGTTSSEQNSLHGIAIRLVFLYQCMKFCFHLLLICFRFVNQCQQICCGCFIVWFFSIGKIQQPFFHSIPCNFFGFTHKPFKLDNQSICFGNS